MLVFGFKKCKYRKKVDRKANLLYISCVVTDIFLLTVFFLLFRTLENIQVTLTQLAETVEIFPENKTNTLCVRSSFIQLVIIVPVEGFEAKFPVIRKFHIHVEVPCNGIGPLMGSRAGGLVRNIHIGMNGYPVIEYLGAEGYLHLVT